MTSEATTGSSKAGFRAKNVTAVLGPTNTGKTHLAIERMLGHQSGMIGLPLRLLAREVYDKIIARGVSPADVALITGEERIKPKSPRFYVCTVEAMPRDLDLEFVAIDEIQLAADPARGHVFTERLLHMRGSEETLLLGADTMRGAITDLVPGCNFISRPRLSKLTYAGQKKLTRLPRRSAIVAFSANEVYEVAELLRRQSGGAAVVLGALSPRTRNAQVALYQNGDVDFLVATDAIGMGLNLDVDHVAFSGSQKFDGQQLRDLTPAELSQIAGRAGRHLNDGTFGVTGKVNPFDSELINRLESHDFEQVKKLQWRCSDLDFSTLEQLKNSLKLSPKAQRLVRGRMANDVAALEDASKDNDVRDRTGSVARVHQLWDVCQVPDYRKISQADHTDLIITLYKYLTNDDGQIPEDWFAEQVALADRTDGDIDTLATRIAHIRTWTFVSNRTGWLKDQIHWQEKTREIENNLSDAMHERLTQRFVDQRTSVLMKRLRDDEDLNAEIADDGSIKVENHYVGKLVGFRFTPESNDATPEGKAARNAAAKVLSKELSMRARRLSAAKADAFSISRLGRISWRGEEIAHLKPGEDPLKPGVQILSDEHLSGPDLEKIRLRMETWIAEEIDERLKPLCLLAKADEVSGLARGVAFRLIESFGILKREDVSGEIKALDQTARGQLRKYGVRFGAFNLYFPQLLKPAASDLLLILWWLKSNKTDEMPEPPRSGLTSVKRDSAIPDTFYRAAGFHVCGDRAVRIDMLERLADMIRPLVSWRAKEDNPDSPPQGATGDGGFKIQPDMMSIMGCSAQEAGTVLHALGFRLQRIPISAKAEAEPATENKSAKEDKSDKDAEITENKAETTENKQDISSSSKDEVEAQQFEEIWRPRKRRAPEERQSQRAKPRKPTNAKPNKGKRAAGQNKPQKSNKKPAPRHKPKPKVADPDSPFAALSKLKKELEDQVQDQP